MSLQGKKVLAIVQARTGSTRLPGKVMLDVCGKPAIYYVLKRTALARLVDQVVLATTDLPGDDALATAAAAAGFPVFRGSENDVVGRFAACLAAQKESYGYLARVCADNFLVCPTVIDDSLRELAARGDDILNPFLENTYPFGVGAEVSTVEAFQRVERGSRGTPRFREHVFFYAYERPAEFRFGTLRAPAAVARPKLNLSVDTAADFARVKRVFEALPEAARLTAGPAEIAAFFDALGGAE
jgi:spore coat polysaccharide biosynthesis protein SpsF